MKNLLVTGVAGFIGSRLAELLLESTEEDLKDCQIIGLDKLGYSGRLENISALKTNERFHFIQGDISDADLVKATYKNFAIDTTVNVAAESHVDNSIKDPLVFVQSNVLGTATLLEAHLRSNAKRFLQVSTDEVYGSIRDGVWEENFSLNPRSPYSASKASADLLVQSFHATYGLDVVITRCCNNYGPRQFPEKVIPLFITNLLTNKKIPIYGDGSNRREWIHVDDHSYGIIDSLLKGVSGHVHHITSDTELSNKELAQEICSVMNEDFADVVKYVEDRKGHDFRYALDDEWTQGVLGSRKKISFRVGLEKTIDWYTSNTEWWKPLVKK
jgi:dTDP-glucose 4,6-dehydratase